MECKLFQTAVSGAKLLYNDLKIRFIAIDYNPRPSANVTPMHAHDFYEFYLLLSGRQHAIVCGHDFPVRENEFFLVPPGVEHGHQHTSEIHDDGICVRFYLEKFSGSSGCTPVADHILQVLSTTHIRAFRDPEIFELLTTIPDQFTTDQLHLRMIFWILRLSHLYESDVSVAPKRNHMDASEEKNLVDRVMLTISTMFMTDLSVKDVAASHNLSYRHLSRIFLQGTGCTLVEAITYHRIHYALRLLRDTALPVHEIAHRSGFRNEAYFTSVFRRYIGQPPTLYRSGAAPCRSWSDILHDFGIYPGHPLFNTTNPWLQPPMASQN